MSEKRKRIPAFLLKDLGGLLVGGYCGRCGRPIAKIDETGGYSITYGDGTHESLEKAARHRFLWRCPGGLVQWLPENTAADSPAL